MSAHVIVLPGGGYQRHAAHEAEPVTAWLTGLGLSASVLRYPVGVRHPRPLDAVRAEVRERRRRGAERVALCGFSAGGHAAGLAALAPESDADERVDAVILGYPVVSMLHDPHPGSRETLLGASPTGAQAEQTSLERLVRADAPPFFVWHTLEDATVPAAHSLLLAESLSAQGVADCALHVFPRGRHGLGLADGSAAGAWRGLAETWLRELGWIPASES